jgi:hypothetical protein
MIESYEALVCVEIYQVWVKFYTCERICWDLSSEVTHKSNILRYKVLGEDVVLKFTFAIFLDSMCWSNPMRLPLSAQQHEGEFRNILRVDDCVKQSTTQSIKNIPKRSKTHKLTLFHWEAVELCILVWYWIEGWVYTPSMSNCLHYMQCNGATEDELHLFTNCVHVISCWKEANLWQSLEHQLHQSGVGSSWGGSQGDHPHWV